ncbi:alpha/beta hydrolase family protein [Halalkalibacter okhensis]|uniref:alpha/beta hydrolase family protein n=1 Tax=Halalkalibacter okhensis TaxID=333138 RepID=UPI000691993D|nr:alpha/beta fold hydrolase [Halalkalibacter okhensis]
MTTKAIRFHSNTLSAVIHKPEPDIHPSPTIIFVHGFIGSKVGEHRMFVKAANYFSNKGFVCFRFDFSGCGESEGDYKDVTVSKQIDELKSAIHYVSQMKEVEINNIIMIGHSLGGALTALTSYQFPFIKDIILWSPVANPYVDITSITGKDAEQIAQINGYFDYKGFLLSKSFFNDLKSHQPLNTIQSFPGSVFVVHGTNDEDIPCQHAESYMQALNQVENQKIGCSFINGADHTFSDTKWEYELFNRSFDWLQLVKYERTPS